MKIFRNGNLGTIIRNPGGEELVELAGEGKRGGAKAHSIAICSIPPGRFSENHRHAISEESFFVIEGDGVITVDGQPFPLSKGDTCLILPGESHALTNPSKKIFKLLVVSAPPWNPKDSMRA